MHHRVEFSPTRRCSWNFGLTSGPRPASWSYPSAAEPEPCDDIADGDPEPCLWDEKRRRPACVALLRVDQGAVLRLVAPERLSVVGAVHGQRLGEREGAGHGEAGAVAEQRHARRRVAE